MYFVVAGLLALVFIGALLFKLFVKDNRGRSSGGGVAAGALVLLIVFTLFMSLTTVEPRSVGIQTSFGKYVDTLDNGTQLVAPWSNVEEFSTQIQPLKLNDKSVPLSFEGGSSGWAEVTVRWQIDSDGAEELWKDWKTFDRVRDELVKPTAQESFRTIFANYSPTDAIDGNNLNQIKKDVLELLNNELGDRGVNIDSVTIQNVVLGERAQNSLDRIVEANANTERAQSEQERATIEAETARIRQESQTPEALERYCLEVMNSWDVAKNGPLPATFNCLGTSNANVLVGG